MDNAALPTIAPVSASGAVLDTRHKNSLATTSMVHYYGSPQGGLTMKGTVRCSGCGKARDNYVCPHCGAVKCYVALYWKNKNYQYRHDKNGVHYGFFEAERFLTVLRAKIDEHRRGISTFDPTEFLQSKINELRFSIKVEEWFADIEKKVRQEARSLGTLETYQSYNKIHWQKVYTDENGHSFSLKDMDVREIDVLVMRKLSNLLPASLSTGTRRSIIRALGTFLWWLRSFKIITVDPVVPTVEGPPAKKRKAITVEVQNYYLSLIPEIHQDIFGFGFETGLREGELAAIMVKDINTETWELTVQRTYTSGNKIHDRTKGRHDDIVPLSDRAIEIVKKNLQDKLPDAWLFLNQLTGRGYLPQRIYDYWVEFTKSPITFHDACRRSFCTQLAKQDVHPKKLQQLMRHSDIRTTFKYISLDSSDLTEIVNNRTKTATVTPITDKARAK
jgi:integrase/predicted RNA-binding Zn-ribbon protein involved in translation (DUF1610 family)